jgi:energy-converting hydrogenase Eha subunit H
MKKFTLLSLIMLVIFVMFISIPAFADTDVDVNIKNSKIQGAIGNSNIGLQTNGAIHHNTINSGTIVIRDKNNNKDRCRVKQLLVVETPNNVKLPIMKV